VERSYPREYSKSILSDSSFSYPVPSSERDLGPSAIGYPNAAAWVSPPRRAGIGR